MHEEKCGAHRWHGVRDPFLPRLRSSLRTPSSRGGRVGIINSENPGTDFQATTELKIVPKASGST